MTKLQLAIPFYWLRYRTGYSVWAMAVFTVIDLFVLFLIGYLIWEIALT